LFSDQRALFGDELPPPISLQPHRSVTLRSDAGENFIESASVSLRKRSRKYFEQFLSPFAVTGKALL
jgi:hypothetical protein